VHPSLYRRSITFSGLSKNSKELQGPRDAVSFTNNKQVFNLKCWFRAIHSPRRKFTAKQLQRKMYFHMVSLIGNHELRHPWNLVYEGTTVGCWTIKIRINRLAINCFHTQRNLSSIIIILGLSIQAYMKTGGLFIFPASRSLLQLSFQIMSGRALSAAPLH
jgi:hypothetical protein